MTLFKLVRFSRRFRAGKSLLVCLILVSFLVSACGSATPQVTSTPASTEQVPSLVPSLVPSPTITLTATPAPRSLVVCLGAEPSTLYPYSVSSRSQLNILEAVYDGPYDTRSFSTQPVILDGLPSFDSGGAVYEAVDVKAEEPVVNSDGDLVALQPGVEVIPSGCVDSSCAVKWDGNAPLKMDRLNLTFKLKPGLKWSDGAPLTSADSIYSFQVASDPATPANRQALSRTLSYAAVDDLTLKWVGVPGFFPVNYQSSFWWPLPQHAWKDITPAELLTSETSTTYPLGWGAYKIDEWVKGDHIRLSRNPFYFRAAEGLPKFENLVFRFVGEAADDAIAAVMAGECDIVDDTVLLDETIDPVIDYQNEGKIKVYIGQTPEWEHLDFGIKPASYDDGYNPGVDRPDFFSNSAVRQAVAYCLDRQTVVDQLLAKQSSIPGGYVPPTHPLYMQDLKPLPYDPEKGSALLDQAGWKDLDNNASTPRTAFGAAGVRDGTPFVLNYLTSDAPMRVETAKYLQASLRKCGIEVHIEQQNAGLLFSPGPEGPVFGRKFDLVQFSWQSGILPPCYFYESSRIPSVTNHWLGVNTPGYQNPAFDSACRLARTTRPDRTEDYQKRQQEVQALFNQELPVIPLYFRIRMAVSRPDLCGFEMDVSARSIFWNLEGLDYGDGCPK